MTEQKEKDLPLEIKGEYKNISLKQKWDEGTLVREGLADGEYIIVEKRFADGKLFNGNFGPSYSCGVVYKGEDVTFWLNEAEHAKYADCGGIGDKVKIVNLKESFVHNKVEKKKNVLHFSQVEE